MLSSNDCPACGGILLCLGGCSAHPSNWYCQNEKTCGWQAWTNDTKKQREHKARNPLKVE